jgi:hypothetical protein
MIKLLQTPSKNILSGLPTMGTRKDKIEGSSHGASHGASHGSSHGASHGSSQDSDFDEVSVGMQRSSLNTNPKKPTLVTIRKPKDHDTKIHYVFNF